MADPIVVVEQGKIRGKIGTDIRGGAFYSFKGIPYARPPIGELRFKAPIPVDHWAGILDGAKEGSPSIQPHPVHKMIGSEDCLHLNVYTPGLPCLDDRTQNTPSYQRPVMVWIHGGAFMYGNNKTSYQGPDFLVAEDVVLVVVNYRLGLLGFLGCEDATLEAPGNAAFKDMILALKWVRKNISNFLGDPNNVTIFGQSAGAAAVDCMVSSPMAKGLFHKVILQSMTANVASLYGKTLKELAKDMGFENHSEREIFEVLRKSSTEDLLMIQEKLEKETPNSWGKKFVGLIIEKPGDSAFLSSSPMDVIKSGKYNNVPMLIGYNSKEGVVPSLFESKWKHIEDFVPFYLNLQRGSPDFVSVAEKTFNRYFSENDYSKETFYDVFQDVFVWTVLSSTRTYFNTSAFPLYLYKFDMDTSLNLFKAANDYDGPGACHGDELGYLFHTRFTPKITPGSEEDLGQRRVVKLWTNFARYGNPTPVKDPLLNITWAPTDKSLRYLAISDTLRMESNPDQEIMAFWDKIHSINSKL